MKMKESLKGKNTYSEIKLTPQVNGSVFLHAKRSDNSRKAMIIGQRISIEIAKQLASIPSNGGFATLKHEYIQRYIEKPFISSIYEEKGEDLYYLIPLQFARKSLKSTLKDFDMPERLEIAYKLAKVVDQLHNKVGMCHGNLSLSTIAIKQKQEEAGISIRLAPPFPEIVTKYANEQSSSPSFYRVPEQSVNRKSDIWSLGIIFFELLLGKEVSASISSVTQDFEYSLDYHEVKSKQLKNMLKNMIQRDADKRISIEQVLNILKPQAIKEIYGVQYRIPLLEEQKHQRKLSKSNGQNNHIKYEEKRIVIKGFVLSIIHLQKNRKESSIMFSLHFKQDFIPFLQIQYQYEQFSHPIRAIFPDLLTIFNEISKKDKYSVRFQTNGVLVICHK